MQPCLFGVFRPSSEASKKIKKEEYKSASTRSGGFAAGKNIDPPDQDMVG